METYTLSREELNHILDSYLQAFNAMDLEAVLTYFSPGAVYEPGDGSRFQGTEQIRESFRPQFAHAWGTFFFRETARIVDLQERKAVLTWDCVIDPSTAKYYTWRTWLRITFGKLMYGRAALWKGVDVLEFSAEGKITAKLTYANYKSLLLQPAEPTS